MSNLVSLMQTASGVAEPIVTRIPWVQVILGVLGLGSMISYAIQRQRRASGYESLQKKRSAVLLLRHVWQWLGEHHYVAGHARTGGK